MASLRLSSPTRLWISESSEPCDRAGGPCLRRWRPYHRVPCQRRRSTVTGAASFPTSPHRAALQFANPGPHAPAAGRRERRGERAPSLIAECAGGREAPARNMSDTQPAAMLQARTNKHAPALSQQIVDPGSPAFRVSWRNCQKATKTLTMTTSPTPSPIAR